MLQNDRLIRALKRQDVDRTPIWLMRQAGRYLPEYRTVREQAGSFMSLCRNPTLACEVTLQPLARFNLDAAIIFSDILTIPDAMGLGLSFETGDGPVFANPIKTAKAIKHLPQPDPEIELRYVMDAIRTTKNALADKVPLIGFSGSPWTLATYMVEGRSSKQFQNIKAMMYREPQLLMQLIDHLVIAVSHYLIAQATAGADVLMIFDSWGGVLSHVAYDQFSLTPMERIIAKIQTTHPDLPIIVFTKGGGQWLHKVAASGCTGIGLDWTTPIKTARELVGHRVALQGNIDPCVLFGSEQTIYQVVAKTLAEFGRNNGHIFNFGHGILPTIDPSKVQYLVDVVHEMSGHYHEF